MAVIDALRRTPEALARNPIIFAIFGLVGLLQLPQLLAQTINPILAALLSLVLSGAMIFITPFVQGGAMRMADDALDGRTSLDAFIAAGKEHYPSMLGAYLIVVGVAVVVTFVGGVVVAVAGTLAAGVGGGLGAGSMLVIALVGGAFALVGLAFAFLVQFYGQEIVIEGASAVEGLKRSVSLVRRNVYSTLGYSLLIFAAGMVVVGGSSALSYRLFPSGPGMGAGAGAGLGTATPSAVAMLGYTVAYVVGSALVGSLLSVYAVAFWKELRWTPDRAQSSGATAD